MGRGGHHPGCIRNLQKFRKKGVNKVSSKSVLKDKYINLKNLEGDGGEGRVSIFQKHNGVSTIMRNVRIFWPRINLFKTLDQSIVLEKQLFFISMFR